uniref:LRRC37A/B like protein 1 C-terminal domain-containing protein n=1 Tax=Latimeria chalumnae TaxID=7897 RepID=H2ZYM8_LATCH
YRNLAHNQIAELPKRSFHSWHGLQFLKMLNISHNPLVKISNAAFEEPPSLLLVDFSGTRLSLPAIQNLLMGSPSLQELILPAQMTCCLCRLAKMSSGLLYQLVKLQCEKDCVSNKGSCGRSLCQNVWVTNLLLMLGMDHKESSSKLTSKLKNYVKQSNNQPKPLVQIPVKVDHIMDFLGGLNESLPEIRPKHNDTNNQTVIIIQSTSKQKLSGKRTKKKNSHTATRKSEKRGSNFKLGSVKHFILNPLIIKNIEEKAKEGKQSETLGSEKSTKGSMKAPVKRQKMLTQQQKQMENGKIKHENKHKTSDIKTLSKSLSLQKSKMVDANLPSAGENDLTKLSLLDSLLTIDIEQVLQKIRLIKMLATKESVDIEEVLQKIRLIKMFATKESNKSSSETSRRMKELPNQRVKKHRKAKEKREKILIKQIALKEIRKDTKSMPVKDNGRIQKVKLGNEKDAVNYLALNNLSNMNQNGEELHGLAGQATLLPEDNDSKISFEIQLSKQIQSLKPSKAVMQLISHIIRILEVDCIDASEQHACSELISKTNELMKLFHEKQKKPKYRYDHRKSNLITTEEYLKGEFVYMILNEFFRKKEQEAQYEYGNKLLLAICVTVIVMIIIAVICLIEV